MDKKIANQIAEIIDKTLKNNKQEIIEVFDKLSSKFKNEIFEILNKEEGD